MVEPVYMDEIDGGRLVVSRKDAFRYLGYYLEKPDETTHEMMESCIAEIQSVMKCRATYTKRPITISGDRIDFGFEQIESYHLARHLRGCSEVILFVATLGSEVDRRIRRYQMLTPARGAVCQAAAASAIEAYCDDLNDRLAQMEEANGFRLRRRFSPGYGDFALSFQKPLLRELDASRKLGLGLTDANLMVPEKSVSAVIGVERMV